MTDDLPDPEDVIAGYNPDDDEDEIGEDLPTPRQIIMTHDRVEQVYDLDYPGARIAAPRLRYERMLKEIDGYDGLYPRAAGLLRKITTEHCFEDGNKRTAWLTAFKYLEDHGHQPAEQETERVDHVMKSLRSYNIEEIAQWLKTGEIDEERLNPR